MEILSKWVTFHIIFSQPLWINVQGNPLERTENQNQKLTYQDLLIGTRSIKGNIHIISFEVSYYNNSLESRMLSQAPGSHLFEM